MEAFYVCIIFLGILLVLVSLFFIIVDRVNGKDFFKEFDRKKEEMFNLIQESDEMVQELNKMSDYVVTVISERNQEFFNKSSNLNVQKTIIVADTNSAQGPNELKNQVEDKINPYVEKVIQKELDETVSVAIPEGISKVIPEATPEEISKAIPEAEVIQKDVISYKNDEPDVHRAVNTQFSYNKDSSDIGKSRLVLNSKRREVLQMIEQGLSNDEISDKLKIGKGEIGLIRGLNK